jgi:NAD(P)-dependent dehydrogenase (short-subunit alcohol dehydrogenase family)
LQVASTWTETLSDTTKGKVMGKLEGKVYERNATKAATRSYARTWAAEFKGRGIRVNTLSPGVTDTPILDSQSETEGRDEVVKMYLNMIPIGRLAEAEEIAAAAVFLASDESSFITGVDLAVDGGMAQV